MHCLFTAVCMYRVSSHFTVLVQHNHISPSKLFYLRMSLGNERWHGGEEECNSKS